MKRKQISMGDLDRMRDKVIDDYFWQNYYNQNVGFGGLCSLCGNSGVIDTRTTAISGAGVNAGRLNYCLCPNGRVMREENAPLEDNLTNHRLSTDMIVKVQEQVKRLEDAKKVSPETMRMRVDL